MWMLSTHFFQTRPCYLENLINTTKNVLLDLFCLWRNLRIERRWWPE